MAQDNSFEWGILMTSRAFHRAINTHGAAAALSRQGGDPGSEHKKGRWRQLIKMGSDFLCRRSNAYKYNKRGKINVLGFVIQLVKFRMISF